MNTTLEYIALAIIVVSATTMIIMLIVNEVQERRITLDPPLPPPAPAPHKPKHAAYGDTTRLRPPPRD